MSNEYEMCVDVAPFLNRLMIECNPKLKTPTKTEHTLYGTFYFMYNYDISVKIDRKCRL